MCHLDFVLICWYGVEKRSPIAGKDKSYGLCWRVFGRAVRAPFRRIVVLSTQRKRLTKWHSFKPQNTRIFSSTSSWRVWNSTYVLLDRYRCLFSRLIIHYIIFLTFNYFGYHEIRSRKEWRWKGVNQWRHHWSWDVRFSQFQSVWVVTPCSLVDSTVPSFRGTHAASMFILSP